MNYSALSLADVGTALGDIAREAQATFGGLDGRQLNWRPDGARWSVAQCFEHLLTTNRLMFEAADDALRAVARVRALDERDAARAVMTSPFSRVVTSSVIDGWRLIVAHDLRHFERARRVTQSPGFPHSRGTPDAAVCQL